MGRLPPKGILHYDEAMRHLRLERAAPAADLTDLVECHWEVAWDLPPGRIHRQRNLSHASVSLAWESDGAWIYGVPGKVFVREITGSGVVFGTKLRSGAARAFFPSLEVHTLTGTRRPIGEVDSPSDFDPLQGGLAFSDRAALTDAWLRTLRRSRAVPVSVALANAIESDRSLLRVETLSDLARLSVRDLQRLFRLEIGIGPKDVVRRFRLQQAADRFHHDPDISCLSMAMELGYFDQAHFARDFRSVVGASPDSYRNRVRASRLPGEEPAAS